MSKITFTDELVVERMQHMGSDDMIARAARVSTGKEKVDGLKIEGLIKYLATSGHTSPFEHNAVTYRIEAPIFVAREAFRHRVFSYNEISGRYAKLAPKFYVPGADRPLVNKGSGARPDLQHGEADLLSNVVWNHENSYTYAWEDYEDMLAKGVATEVARNVLPVGIYTSWMVTGNLHAWLHFLSLRTASNAQWEIRELAKKIDADLAELFPLAMKYWPRDEHNEPVAAKPKELLRATAVPED